MPDLQVHDTAHAPATQPVRALHGRDPHPAASEAAPAPATPEDVRNAVAATLAAVAPHTCGLEFEVDQGRTIVRVVDRETKELVRQIPSEELVEIRRTLERVQGILIRSKA